jgi:hypothetical protein
MEPDKLLHQLFGSLSRLDVHGGTWRRWTVMRARHRGLE